MADNIIVTPGTGATIAADDISSVLYQRVKLIHGADGVNAGDVAAGNPLPVVQTGTPALATGAATEASLAAIIAALADLATELVGKLEAGESVDVGNFPATQPVSGPLTDDELRAADVPVSGTVTANLGTIAGTATAANQATIITALGALLVELGDKLDAGGSVAVSNFPATQPVSAAALPLPSGAAAETTLGTRVAEATFTARLGEVQASPTANTLLARLKDLLTGISLAASTAAIGKLAANDGVDVGDVTINNAAGAGVYARPGTAEVFPVSDNGGSLTVDGAVRVALQTDAIQDGATALTPKFASVAASSSGNNSIVALVASKKIRVLSYVLVAAGTVAVKWRSASTDKTGAMSLVANTGISVNFSPVGHLETVAGEALNLNLDNAVAVSGHISYVEV